MGRRPSARLNPTLLMLFLPMPFALNGTTLSTPWTCNQLPPQKCCSIEKTVSNPHFFPTLTGLPPYCVQWDTIKCDQYWACDHMCTTRVDFGLASCTSCRDRVSLKTDLCSANPFVSMGMVVSHIDAPFSCASSRHFNWSGRSLLWYLWISSSAACFCLECFLDLADVFSYFW